MPKIYEKNLTVKSLTFFKNEIYLDIDEKMKPGL
jgi:hypothetical protein